MLGATGGAVARPIAPEHTHLAPKYPIAPYLRQMAGLQANFGHWRRNRMAPHPSLSVSSFASLIVSARGARRPRGERRPIDETNSDYYRPRFPRSKQTKHSHTARLRPDPQPERNNPRRHRVRG